MTVTPPIKLTDDNHQRPSGGALGAAAAYADAARADEAEGVDIDADELTRDIAAVSDRAADAEADEVDRDLSATPPAPDAPTPMAAAVDRIAGAIELAAASVARPAPPVPPHAPRSHPVKELVLLTRIDSVHGGWNAKPGALKSAELHRPWYLDLRDVVGVRPAHVADEGSNRRAEDDDDLFPLGDEHTTKRITSVGTVLSLYQGGEHHDITVAEPMRAVVSLLRDHGYGIAPTDATYECTIRNIVRVPRPEPKPRKSSSHKPARKSASNRAAAHPPKKAPSGKPNASSAPAKAAQSPPAAPAKLPPMF